MKMSNHTIVCAGIDTGKSRLDAAIGGTAEHLQLANMPDGHMALSAWLRQHQVERIGIEATGGYEHTVVTRLRADGFTVIVFQPGQVRAYARFKLKRAKTDRIDAALIAACAAAREEEEIHAPPDPRIAPFAEQLTMIEQITEDIARIKTRRENVRDQAIRQAWKDEIKRLGQQKRARLKALIAVIRQHPTSPESSTSSPPSTASDCRPPSPFSSACPRSERSHVKRPPPSQASLPTPTTVATMPDPDISKAAANA
jgi:transposase